MSTTRRRRYSAEFKAKVALEAIRGEALAATSRFSKPNRNFNYLRTKEQSNRHKVL